MSGENHRSNRISLILSLLAIVAAVLVVRWVVINKRPAGSMTPIEAQGMDMTTMKPPPGTQPVSVEQVQFRGIAPSVSLPATIQAYSDEDVMSRLPGKLSKVLVYPGDKVRAGQLLAVIDADEYASQAGQAGLQSQAAFATTTVAEREVQRLQVVRERMALEVGAKMAHETHERANRDAAAASWYQSQEAIKTAEAKVARANADLTYQVQSLEREKRLYKAGAISLDELQQAQSSKDKSEAEQKQAVAEQAEANKAAGSMEKQVKAADAAVAIAIGEHAAARRQVQEVDKEINKARAEQSVRQKEAGAMSAGANTANIIAGYRQLRALDNAVVTERTTSPGSLVQAGTTVLKLKVIAKVRLQIQVPSSLTNLVRVGSRVSIMDGSTLRTAMISAVFPSQNPETRTFAAEAVLDNASGSLLPGMYLKANLQQGDGKRVLSVPSEAIRKTADGKTYVWVLQERKTSGKVDWTCPMHPEISKPGPGPCPICKMDLVRRESSSKFVAQMKFVDAGASDSKHTAVSGLSEGDIVIFRGYEDIGDGSPVEPDRS